MYTLNSTSFSPASSRWKHFSRSSISPSYNDHLHPAISNAFPRRRPINAVHTEENTNADRDGERRRPSISRNLEEIGSSMIKITSSHSLLNAAIVLGAGSLAITKLLTIDHDYWHGWTLYEILRYAPEHNWSAYEEALRTHPVLAKMAISGIVYSLGDWIAQCYEGKPLFEFDRTRLLRSGLVGFALHGSLSYYYYQYSEALIPSRDWWVVLAKVAFDQSVWAAVWNSIYYVVLGLLRFESPEKIFHELKATFWPMLTAGWKVWLFAHLITYGVIPVEKRLLWVDCIELIWVTILSTYANERSEVWITEAEPAGSQSSKYLKQRPFSSKNEFLLRAKENDTEV